MNNVVIGSGINGLLARHIVGDCKIIPHKKSRYYSYQIPIADNEIEWSDAGSQLFKELGLIVGKSYFPTAISYCGELTFNKRVWASTIVDKIFDNHPYASTMLARDINIHEFSAKMLYDLLLDKYYQEFKDSTQTISKINGNKITTNNGEQIEYGRIISTIPLNSLAAALDLDYQFESRDYHVFLVGTDAFNLEGAQRCYIGDIAIPFWKVNIISNNLYQFFANGFVDGADKVFAMLTRNRYKIVAQTTVKEAFPVGMPPIKLIKDLEDKSIYCVGSNARWDYFFDLSSSISKLMAMR